jgi:adenosine deaminase
MLKVELHLHLEGPLEPLLLALAKKSNVKLDYDGVEEVQKAYNLKSLDDFLKLYYQGMEVLVHESEGMEVLVHESDFYDLAWAYLTRIHHAHVRHVEVFFDPQPHMERRVSFKTVVKLFLGALQTAEIDYKMTSKLYVLCTTLTG